MSRGLLLASFLAVGCAIRTAGSEHYFGPVVFRYEPSCAGRADVSEVVHAGLLGEAGAQWGLSVGVLDRVAAAPRAADEPPCQSSPLPEWKALVTVPSTIAPKRWIASPFYLRRINGSARRFVRRSLIGAQVLSGPEANALSLGIVSATIVRPPENAMCAIRFDASRPLETRFTVWSITPDGEPPAESILNEVDE